MSSEPRGGQCWLLVSNNREPRGKVGVATFLGVWMNFRSFPSGRLWPGCPDVDGGKGRMPAGSREEESGGQWTQSGIQQ